MRKIEKIWFLIPVFLYILVLSGCGGSGSELVESFTSGLDGNTRLLYKFSKTPSAFVSDSNTMALYHMDEGSGLTTGDSSSNGVTANLISGATWSSGFFGNAVSLTGGAAYFCN